MGEVHRSNHDSTTKTMNCLRTDRKKCTERFSVVEEILTKIVRVQQLHMDMIWYCCTFEDVEKRSNYFIERQKTEYKHLEGDIKLLQKSMQNQIRSAANNSTPHPAGTESIPDNLKTENTRKNTIKNEDVSVPMPESSEDKLCSKCCRSRNKPMESLLKVNQSDNLAIIDIDEESSVTLSPSKNSTVIDADTIPPVTDLHGAEVPVIHSDNRVKENDFCSVARSYSLATETSRGEKWKTGAHSQIVVLDDDDDEDGSGIDETDIDIEVQCKEFPAIDSNNLKKENNFHATDTTRVSQTLPKQEVKMEPYNSIIILDDDDDNEDCETDEYYDDDNVSIHDTNAEVENQPQPLSHSSNTENLRVVIPFVPDSVTQQGTNIAEKSSCNDRVGHASASNESTIGKEACGSTLNTNCTISTEFPIQGIVEDDPHVQQRKCLRSRTLKLRRKEKKFASEPTLSRRRRRHDGGTKCETVVVTTKRTKPRAAARKPENPSSCECPICGKKFAGIKRLNGHMQIHSGKHKRYKCTDCKMEFKLRSTLVRHMLVHGGRGWFKCTVCKHGFITRRCLAVHMRIHSGEKPFKCTICGRKFRQCGNLKRHMFIHSGYKPYKCEICGHGFARRHRLVMHVKTHHDKAHKCKSCGCQFKG